MNDVVACFIVLILGLLMGGNIGASIVESTMQKDAIAHGAAHYDATTGKFTWNNPPVSTPADTTR